MQRNPNGSELGALIARIESLGLVWRLSSPGVMGTDTRAEAMVKAKAPKSQWCFGYGSTAEEALENVLRKVQV